MTTRQAWYVAAFVIALIAAGVWLDIWGWAIAIAQWLLTGR